MHQKVISKIISFILLCAMSTCMFFYDACVPVYAAEMDLKDQISSATVLIQGILRGQYETLEKEIEKECLGKGYDVALTKETYKDKGNPYKDFGYMDLIAIYASVQEYISNTGNGRRIKINSLPFISYEIKEEKTSENKPVKIENYEPSEGYYIKSGYSYVNKAVTTGVYEETGKTDVSGNSLYKKTGEKRLIPEKTEQSYGQIRLKILAPEDIITMAGIDKKEIEDDVNRRKNLMERVINGEELTSSVFLSFPEISIDSEGWNSLFINNIALVTNSTAEIMPTSDEIVCAAAESLMGVVPYQWGGKPVKAGFDSSWWTYDMNLKEQRGLDCSGFVRWAYMTAGYNKDVTDKMASTAAIKNSGFNNEEEWELKPGDIGVTERTGTNHCGIYAGNGEWYHCSSDKNTVVRTPYTFTKFFRPEIKEVSIPEETVSRIAEAKENINAGINIAPITANISQSESDVMTLAQLMTHEAGSEGINGWIAVGEVVRNRILSPLFPGSVSEVTFQKGQFASVSSIRGITPRPEVIETARNVLYGGLSVLNNSSVLYFRNPTTTSGISAKSPVNWGRHKYYTYVGHHAFYC